jgi:hypothetical protein
LATTINDLIKDSYRVLNVIGERGTLTSEQLTQGLRFLNRLLDSWNTKFSLPPSISQSSFNLVANQKSYTIGSGGDVNTTRPLRILNAVIVDGDYTYPCKQINYYEWSELYDKESPEELPSKFYYDANVPLGTIYLYPKPSKVVSFSYSQERKYGEYALNDSISLTPGVEYAIVSNLAKTLLPMYPSEVMGPVVIQDANTSLENLMIYHCKLHNRDVGTDLDDQVDGDINHVA